MPRLRVRDVSPLDLAYAASGYLSDPDGRLRFVWSLDRIAGSIVTAGCRVYWAPIEPLGYCYCWSRVILLSPAVAGLEPWLVRHVFSHELAHAVCGASNERAWDWQEERFGDLIRPDPPYSVSQPGQNVSPGRMLRQWQSGQISTGSPTGSPQTVMRDRGAQSA